jgi:PAS domain-containing protein
LKIDAAFVHDMTTKRLSRLIVSGVMGLCQNLGLDSVAEGIETRGQMEMLQRFSCHSGQGWLFGRPAPASDVAAMLEGARRPLPEPSVASIAEEVALRLEALPIQRLWQLRAVYEGAPVGLAFLDHNFHFLAANERLAEMLGLPIAAFLGRPVAEVVPDLAH